MRILRHELEIADYQTILLPARGELLSVAMSRTHPNTLIDLWSLNRQEGVGALVDAGTGRSAGVYVVGTGNPMPSALNDDLFTQHDPGIPPVTWRRFLGTVVTPSTLVWHVFEGPLL